MFYHRDIGQNAQGVPVDTVVFHWTAGKWTQKHTPEEIYAQIDRDHVRRGWRMIGYHYVIFWDGRVMKGRRLDEVGAGVLGHNFGKVHVLFIERAPSQQIGKFSDHFTWAQAAAARALCQGLPGIKRVVGHNDLAATLCPGFRVNEKDWL